MSNFQTLDVAALETVTGGKAKASTSSSDLTAQLTSLQSSISDLAKQPQKKGLFGNPTNALLFGLVAMRNREQQASSVVVVR